MRNFGIGHKYCRRFLCWTSKIITNSPGAPLGHYTLSSSKVSWTDVGIQVNNNNQQAVDNLRMHYRYLSHVTQYYASKNQLLPQTDSKSGEKSELHIICLSRCYSPTCKFIETVSRPGCLYSAFLQIHGKKTLHAF